MVENLSTFIVTYTYVSEMERRRSEHRQDHLAWLHEMSTAGRMILAGAALDPVDTAVLVIRGVDAHDVRQILLGDPYARANLIVATSIRPFGLAIGG